MNVVEVAKSHPVIIVGGGVLLLLLFKGKAPPTVGGYSEKVALAELEAKKELQLAKIDTRFKYYDSNSKLVSNRDELALKKYSLGKALDVDLQKAGVETDYKRGVDTNKGITDRLSITTNAIVANNQLTSAERIAMKNADVQLHGLDTAKDVALKSSDNNTRVAINAADKQYRAAQDAAIVKGVGSFFDFLNPFSWF